MSQLVCLNDIYKLIDLYNCYFVNGERLELLVVPFCNDNSKRVISLGLQGSSIKNNKYFVIENNKKFENVILPKLVSYYLKGDKNGKWNIVTTTVENCANKAIVETFLGNIFYYESYMSSSIELLKRKTNELLNTNSFNDEEIIWHELFLYSKKARAISNICNFNDYFSSIFKNIIKLLDLRKEFSSSNNKKYIKNNQKLFKELLEEEGYETLSKCDFDYELINNLTESDINSFADLIGATKRFINHLDANNYYIVDMLSFTIFVLDKIGYYSIDFNESFIDSKVKCVETFLKIVDSSIEYIECKDRYLKYCESLIRYLNIEKSKLNKQDVKDEINEELLFEQIDFQSSSNSSAMTRNVIVDSNTNKSIYYNDYCAKFDQLHKYIIDYKVCNNDGNIIIINRNDNSIYNPKDKYEKNNIEFAFYWSIMTGVISSKNDIFLGEKFAFNSESQRLFEIIDTNFKNSIIRNVDVDLNAIKSAFYSCGTDYIDVYNRLFKDSYCFNYIKKHYLNCTEFINDSSDNVNDLLESIDEKFEELVHKFS